MKRRWYSFVLALLLALLFTEIAVSAQKRPSTVAELAFYNGTDRQQILEEGARKEGKLVFYTTSVWAPPMVNAFQKRYPFIKVDIWRASTTELLPRILEENKVGSNIFDIVESTPTAQLVLQKAGITQPFFSPNLAYIDEGASMKAPGTGVFAAGFRESGLGLGYNTKLITREAVPKTYRDLLNPQWKGRIPITAEDTSVNWVGTLLVNFGEDFVNQIAKQGFQVHTASARGILDMIINGEYEFSPTMFDSHVMSSKGKGAPVDWMPLEPVHVNIGLIALPKKTSHPHAGLLFIDFELSEEGAEINKAGGYSPTRKDVAGAKTYKKYYGVQSLEEWISWNKLFNSLFLKK